ncbi:cytochrome bc1 complex Rieske iron-sulfur subunit [Arthrobacter sp. KN11-1C]|jgi:ubiquinol-cytochrome c reductase iron-sulfur subunit|uniref:cytochrome bc1 complex Rieske iron-sulfur subunit n=1 Tax=Arthrobacter TaxID=1663 RepID=UPI001F5145CA|nr:MULTISPECIES: Rieske 2Fe-2S domain-containing protein [Arthrobacter]MCI0143361.1 Rieske 2Fe-2S domain-containing protein [Arthrobacter bambusae]MDQ0210763.1 ubiquinol-cytochrome c reductase iron-sulfur subunit [Arthrobacter bambusae]MDQ0235435.1 ubiquinol-cytochrome c reductase iron-sulfur subunit [Arthrobacter bambusae]UYY79875.1 Rieske 2Fe-2S domain-containing protein [Arthrobacter sp. YA7-1]
MGNHSDGSPNHSGTVATAGQNDVEKFQDPGLPPHRLRLADTDPRAAKRAERQVAILFGISVIGTVIFLVSYFAIDLHTDGSIATIRNQNLLLGLGTAFAMLGIGTGIVHWAKALMPDHEVSEERHAIRTEEDRQAAVRIVEDIVEETGIKRRPLIRNTLLGAVALAPLPALAVFGDLGPRPDDKLAHTMWAPQDGKLKRLTRDPDGTPIKASDVTIGSAFHVIPEGLNELQEGKLNAKAKAVVLLMRLNPEDLTISKGRETWSYNGIVAYSKICTHVGCPVALYEQQTHHLLCPCHQSTFDLTKECKVIFGPASRPLPQLPIAVDAEGYLVATSDFKEPVGPSYWERDEHERLINS